MKSASIPQDTEPVRAVVQSKANSPHRILVVDDDAEIRRLNAKVLLNSGFHVDAAEDGAEAWENLQLHRYDLLVTDNDMPKVTGVELLKKLHAARMALPVILATAVAPNEAFSASPLLPLAAILLKPYTPREFLETVQEALRATVNAPKPDGPPPDLKF